MTSFAILLANRVEAGNRPWASASVVITTNVYAQARPPAGLARNPSLEHVPVLPSGVLSNGAPIRRPGDTKGYNTDASIVLSHDLARLKAIFFLPLEGSGRIDSSRWKPASNRKATTAELRPLESS